MASVQWAKLDGVDLPASPEVPIFAVGDIHAQPGLLSAAAAAIRSRVVETGLQNWRVVLLGDLIDRGTAVLETLECLSAMREAERGKVLLVKGNHEETFRAYIERRLSAQTVGEWIDLYGGRETLSAVGIDPHDAIARYETEAPLAATPGARQLYRVCTVAFDHFVTGAIGFAHTPGDAQRLKRRHGLRLAIHGHVVVESVSLTDGLINLDLGSYIHRTVGMLEIGPNGTYAAAAG